MNITKQTSTKPVSTTVETGHNTGHNYETAPDTQEHYSTDEQKTLLGIARKSIQYGLETGKPHAVNLEAIPPKLRQQRATFVTLNKQDQLRGCIGVIEARQALALDTAQNAFSAAFNDPRFQPLQPDELSQLRISLSILSPPNPLQFESEQELLEKIQPGIDGLILEAGYYRGVFLPSVWESLPDPTQFLSQLKRKAGLPVDYWSEDVQVSYFRTAYFSEQSD